MVTDGLGPSGQAAGGIGGVADSLEGVVVLLMIRVHHKHGGFSKGGRDEPLGTILQVSAGLLRVPRGLENLPSSSISPSDVVGICSWKMEMGFPLNTGFLFSALIVPLTMPRAASSWNTQTFTVVSRVQAALHRSGRLSSRKEQRAETLTF